MRSRGEARQLRRVRYRLLQSVGPERTQAHRRRPVQRAQRPEYVASARRRRGLLRCRGAGRSGGEQGRALLVSGHGEYE